MTTTRQQWSGLDPEASAAIEAQTGPILNVEPVAEGFNSEIAVVVHGYGGVSVFVKGLRSDHPRAWTQHQEAIVNPHVVPVGPRLLWHAQTAGWDLLGFDHVHGHRADYSPASTDLRLVAAAHRQLSQARALGLPLKRAEQRWSRYCDTPELFAGDALLHTDWNPANVLIGDRAHVVDWAWPTYGASWIDAACWVVWLITHGHAPARAEHWAAQTTAWHAAPPPGLDAFALAQARMWADIAQHDPWAEPMAEAAERWATHRRTSPAT